MHCFSANGVEDDQDQVFLNSVKKLQAFLPERQDFGRGFLENKIITFLSPATPGYSIKVNFCVEGQVFRQARYWRMNVFLFVLVCVVNAQEFSNVKEMMEYNVERWQLSILCMLINPSQIRVHHLCVGRTAMAR